MSAYTKAAEAIDKILTFSFETIAPTHEERMEKINAKADQLRLYIDSRVCQLEKLSSDTRNQKIPISFPDEDLEKDRNKTAKDGTGSSNDRHYYRNLVILGLIGCLIGTLLGNCEIMKKRPIQQYEKRTKRRPYIGTLAMESSRRQFAYLQTGCNSFEGNHKRSTPLAFWTEQDILRYIKERGLKIPSVYGEIVAVDQYGDQYEPMPGLENDTRLICTGCQRTGCIFCAFGAQCEKSPNRFEKLKETHPKQYDFCMRDENGLGMGAVLDYLKIKH